MSTELARNFGTLTDYWKDANSWAKFTSYLEKMDEGTDSDGRPMSLARYALFLELYVALDQAERVEARPESELKDMVLSIRDHQEDFFGIERCLRCIDKGMRSQVLTNLKKVSQDEIAAGTWIYQPVYPRVLDKINELTGHYHSEVKLKEKQQAEK